MVPCRKSTHLFKQYREPLFSNQPFENWILKSFVICIFCVWSSVLGVNACHKRFKRRYLAWRYIRLRRKLGNECVCMPTLNLYEIVIGLFVKRESRIQIFKHIARNFTFLWKCVKRISHRKENGVDALKIHHDSLSKTKKNTAWAETKPCLL